MVRADQALERLLTPPMGARALAVRPAKVRSCIERGFLVFQPVSKAIRELRRTERIVP
jgi:hypothetical protein